MLRRFSLALVMFVGSACSGGDSHAPSDGAPPDISTDGRYNADDGTPTRLPCTSKFGNQLSAAAT
ncbi:MAG: hypothetical protein ABI467_24900, partial [Kofleriaceae bacterium]